ncbi:helix-turn-helix domain-containing protein [Bradyrhizobium sp. JR18.2]|uniref:helix-turn-helix domain-containing protein n=1 Tax=Bradyrhizobium sp. JR18.2 TaxID=3156369 RepID=UPI003396CD5D
MEESRQFVAYQETIRARNVHSCNSLLSRLARFHGEKFVKVEQVVIVEAPPEPELPPPSVPEWITSVEEGPRKPTISEIRKCVAKHFKVSANDLDSSRRISKIVIPRQIGFYLARKLTTRSLPEIGRRFGGKDHTTVLHGSRVIEQKMNKDPNFARTVAALEAQFS